jgi:hypothetical protein
MIFLLECISGVFILYGTFLLKNNDIKAWYLYIVGTIIWCYIYLYVGLHIAAGIQFLFLVQSIYSIIRWKVSFNNKNKEKIFC